MTIAPVESRPLPNVPVDEQGLRQLEIWLQNLTIIRHGHDHRCGGLDPVPMLCELIDFMNTLEGGGTVGGGTGSDYSSSQTGTFTHVPDGASNEITDWPRMTIPKADWNANIGNDLYGKWSAEVDNVYTVVGISYDRPSLPAGETLPKHVTSEPVAGDGWGWAIQNAGTAVTPTSTVSVDIDVWMFQDDLGTAAPTISTRRGQVDLWWVAHGGTPPAGTGSGYSLYTGNIAYLNGA